MSPPGLVNSIISLRISVSDQPIFTELSTGGKDFFFEETKGSEDFFYRGRRRVKLLFSIEKTKQVLISVEKGAISFLPIKDTNNYNVVLSVGSKKLMLTVSV